LVGSRLESLLEREGTIAEAALHNLLTVTLTNGSKRDQAMKLYSSFLVRCWVIREEGQAERLVFDVEHIQKGEHQRTLTPEAALDYIKQVSQQVTPESNIEPESNTEMDD
jgi:hypothetical protein